MAFAVQNNDGTAAQANAYITVEYMRAFHADRGLDLSAKLDADLQTAIVRATDYLDTRFRFVGRRRVQEQTTEWPREGAYDSDRYHVTGIPEAVKEACASYAQRALTVVLNPDPVRDDNGALVLSKSEKVGPIDESTTYAAGATFQMPKYPEADARLRRSGLTRTGGEMRRG